GIALLDLDYAEDSACETDMNVVMTSSGALVEIQGTAEGKPFSDAQLQALLALARSGIARLIEAQKAALAAPGRTCSRAGWCSPPTTRARPPSCRPCWRPSRCRCWRLRRS